MVKERFKSTTSTTKSTKFNEDEVLFELSPTIAENTSSHTEQGHSLPEFRSSETDVAYLQKSIAERSFRKPSEFAADERKKHTFLEPLSNNLEEALVLFHSLDNLTYHYIIARDGTQLAYGHYKCSDLHPLGLNGQPVKPKAALILMILNNPMLEKCCRFIATNYEVDVFPIFVRGFSASSGKRGWSKHNWDYFADIQMLIRHIQRNYLAINVYSTSELALTPFKETFAVEEEPEMLSYLPTFLTGFEMSSAIICRFLVSKWYNLRITPISGTAFISIFCPATRSVQKTSAHFNASINRWGFLTTILCGGWCYRDTPIVKVVASDAYYSIHPTLTSLYYGYLVKHLYLTHPEKCLHKSKLPFLMLYGEKDATVRLESTKIWKPKGLSRVQIVPDGDLVSLNYKSTRPIGEWIMSVLPTLPPTVAPWTQKAQLEYVGYIESIKVAHWIPYKHFTGKERSRASLLFITDTLNPIKTNMLSSHLADLVTSHRVQTFLIDSQTFVEDIVRMVEFIKANHPSYPLVIGGDLTIAARLVYELHRFAKLINGVLLVDPPVSLEDNRPYLVDESVILDEQAKQKKKFSETLCLSSCFSKESERSKYKDKLDCLDKVFGKLLGPFALLLSKNRPDLSWAALQVRFGDELKGPFRLLDCYASLDKLFTLTGEWIAGLTCLSTGLTTKDIYPDGRKPRMEDFTLIKLIGKGAFGRVWLVRHILSNAYLALKMMDKQDIWVNQQLKYIKNEQRTLRIISRSGASSYPFLVPYIGSFQDSTRIFLLMDYLIGGEILGLLQKFKPLGFPTEWARFYTAEAILALEYLHLRGFVYRDLKCENVMLDSMGHIRLIDFGFARQATPPADPLTSFCGSPFYLAPEIITLNLWKKYKNSNPFPKLYAHDDPLREPHYTMACDIWSLGVWMYEMLTGKLPFTGQTQNQIYRSTIYDDPDWNLPGLEDPDVVDLLNKLMSKRPENRPTILEIKRHKWFRGLDWGKLERREITPPFQPDFASASDTRNFGHINDPELEKLDLLRNATVSGIQGVGGAKTTHLALEGGVAVDTVAAAEFTQDEYGGAFKDF